MLVTQDPQAAICTHERHLEKVVLLEVLPRSKENRVNRGNL